MCVCVCVCVCFLWVICLKAYQLLKAYLILKFDKFVNVLF